MGSTTSDAATARTASPAPTAHQPSLADIGTPLSRVTFVVVDLETTGGSPIAAAITEVGAVKVRGSEVLGEFQTLVDPGTDIPPYIASLTGITQAMVRGAPTIAQVLPSFLEFARDAVLVAHNAPFDVGFLKAAAREHGYDWPGPQVVDTVQLAKRCLTREEVPNNKLATLARYFRTSIDPNHRALSDARATVDVLHGLLERLASFGVTHQEDLATAGARVSPARRAKRTLADHLPEAPGVYQFVGPGNEVLYVGTATRLRTRVRTYFTAAETRRRMEEMVALAERVDATECGTVLEARVRELRLITALAPRYNKRSKFPGRMPWVRLTDETFPRLSCVTQVRGAGGPGVAPDAGGPGGPGSRLPRGGTAPVPAAGGPSGPGSAPSGDGAPRTPDTGTYLGPFTSRKAATAAIEALQATFPVRRCADRLPARPSGRSACSLAGLGRCGAPCVGGQDEASYGEVVAAVRAAVAQDPAPVVAAHAARIAQLMAQERFEEAAAWRDRLTGFLRAAARTARSARLAGQPQILAGRRTEAGGWELVVIRHGRLAATATTPPRSDPTLALPALLATAEHVEAPVAPATAAHPEETELLAAWLDEDGVRFIEVGEGWACPVRGAEAWDTTAVAAAVTGFGAADATAGAVGTALDTVDTAPGTVDTAGTTLGTVSTADTALGTVGTVGTTHPDATRPSPTAHLPNGPVDGHGARADVPDARRDRGEAVVPGARSASGAA